MRDSVMKGTDLILQDHAKGKDIHLWSKLLCGKQIGQAQSQHTKDFHEQSIKHQQHFQPQIKTIR